MRLSTLLEASMKQYNIEQIISDLNRNSMFFIERGMRGPSAFESGKCYEFALALHTYLESIGEKSEIIFLVGNFKKSQVKWYFDGTEDFDPTMEHPFHTIVKVRKFYYDANGRLGNKRDITSNWPKFRNKRLVTATVDDIKQYIKDHQLVTDLITEFKKNHDKLNNSSIF
jgi:hypothetical protein